MQTRASRQLQQDREQHRAERYERIGRQMPPKTLHKAVMGGETCAAAPKIAPLRDQALRDMAENRPCLLLVPGTCNHRTDTTVLCHENQGKGMGTKQSDERAVFGCAACHDWYDRSGAPREQKRAAFMSAHLRQVLAWRQIASDPAEPERFRRSARRALERLNATPLPQEAV